ncbi:MAG: tryptophan halogenase family protein [Hellea sp.]
MANTHQNRIKTIVIVGGGSAGWMTAAALSSLLTPETVSITLVESDQIGTVGVGEATIPDMLNFNAMLGINEAEFLKATNGTFKLGIEFNDWGRKGESYIHPFGNIGVDMQGIDFHQYWLHAKAGGNPAPLQNYSMCSVAASHNKFTLPDPNPRSVLSHMRYAYHIDATLYAKYLRGYAEKNGITRVEGKVEDVELNSETGEIHKLTLENGDTIPGDFFFDCTGFRALLTEKTLGVPFTDWSHWLPCDSALTVASERVGALLPYTKATAKTAGWQWRIPTQHRTGNGHIYSSKFMGDEEAKNILKEGLDSKALGEPRKISFKTGCRATLWNKNCIAIGLSAGFLEPLESTSLFLIQMGITRFISLFPTADVSEAVRNEYNAQMLKEFHQVRDFIILHYVATQRDDSAFWNYCRTMSIPDSLTRKIDLFSEAGRVFRYDGELFSKPSWIAVCLGQNIMPKANDPIVSSLPYEQVQHSLDSMRSAMNQAAQKMPPHEDFLKQYGAAV